MKQYYISMKDELQDEKKFYTEELGKKDWKHLKEAGEIFLIHAYSHLFVISSRADKIAKIIGADASKFQVLFNDEYKIKYSQFYLNLAVGLELILKSILLRKGERITLSPEKTITLGTIIDKYFNKIFLNMGENTFEEIKNTLNLINLRRNNISHRSKKSYDSYAHEYRFSYTTLYIYERFFHRRNQELTALLIKSIERSKVTQGSDFNPLRIKPRSLRKSSNGA